MDPSRPFPEPLVRFVDLVNRGEFWESHEVLEDAWRREGSAFYHGLILYASAFVHARRGTPHGIRAQLAKAEEMLAGHPSPYLGLDVDAIREHARRTRRRVEESSRGREADREVDWAEVVELPALELSPDRIRGDEAELGGGGRP